LINSRYPLFSATSFCFSRKDLHIPEAHLLPKLRCQFAEFLNQSSLKRLRMLSSPTCVGFRYGLLIGSDAGLFLEALHRSVDKSLIRATPHSLSVIVLRLWHEASYKTNLRGCTGIQYPADLAVSVLPHRQHLTRRYRNINLFSIDYALRPRLRSRLTQGG
jgi:hypothetical protein